ncbi:MULTISPECIES: ornithine decarboxylase [unclassified Pseudomonas]|uniref:ornithine decarboxylase n=1 Tax=unclassified Pseudomonas TaxID=196821 RepID=UPI00128DD21D|nr:MULTISPECIES: ornithine decarboxylase [unclassified Pseudomonas]MPQ65880.1 ornithine decarboxylase [Pseudomonas sp. MWU12-2323]
MKKKNEFETIESPRISEVLLPPFFSALTRYVSRGNITFACPGHQGIDFFSKHPAGQEFIEFFGENLFRSDVPHADPVLGELLSHGGPPGDAEVHAASVFNADRTYFVLNGTSASNKVVANALLTPGDCVLFDRNNHKSCYHGALIQAGATPVYLEAARNAFGLIGGIPEHCFDERYLRNRLKAVAPERAEWRRPFRLAILQSGTWDGTVYDAREVVNKIGHLCDYILFDSAWLGYEQFISVIRDCSPLLLSLDEESPGIIVTQSVHKQLAGFSQASQIHKKDDHIQAQVRYCHHDRFNNAFMLHASTSPFYPLFASLDVNAKIHSQGSGQRLWMECVRLGIEARKAIFSACEMITPFVPPCIEGIPWQDYGTDTILNDARFFEFSPSEQWHHFVGYGRGQYSIDPCKLLLTTPGINLSSGEYEDFGVPATILAHYLRDKGVVPEKSDLNSIVFLLTPAVGDAKICTLVSRLREFEFHIKSNSLLIDVVPSVCQEELTRYQDYRVADLCQEMHLLYARFNFKKLLRDMFSEAHFPRVVLSPYEANLQLVRGHVELIPLATAKGRVAAEGVVPYPPGIMCIAPGEQWGDAVLDYVIAIETFMNAFPYFSPDIQGVHRQVESDGKQCLYGYVVKS